MVNIVNWKLILKSFYFFLLSSAQVAMCSWNQTARGINKHAVMCGLHCRLHRHKYSNLWWLSKELKVMFLKPVRHTACEFLQRSQDSSGFSSSRRVKLLKKVQKNPTFHIFHLSSVYCAAPCCRNASAPGDGWSGGLQMFKKVVFQKRWLHFNLNLHGDICFYPFFCEAALHRQLLYLKKKKKTQLPPPSLHSAPR